MSHFSWDTQKAVTVSRAHIRRNLSQRIISLLIHMYRVRFSVRLIFVRFKSTKAHPIRLKRPHHRLHIRLRAGKRDISGQLRWKRVRSLTSLRACLSPDSRVMIFFVRVLACRARLPRCRHLRNLIWDVASSKLYSSETFALLAPMMRLISRTSESSPWSGLTSFFLPRSTKGHAHVEFRRPTTVCSKTNKNVHPCMSRQ